MGFLHNVFGKVKTNRQDDSILHLWKNAMKLGISSDGESERRVAAISEIISLVTQGATSLKMAPMFYQRGVTYRILRKYDAALEDLKKAIELGEQERDQNLIWSCQRVMEGIRADKRSSEVEAGGGKKAEKFKAMQQQVDKLHYGSSPEADSAFESLFADLVNDDPDIRDEAARLLADSDSVRVLQRIIAIYEECLNSDRRRASLAGRVLGRSIIKKRDMEIDASEGQVYYGIPISFISCPCVRCGHLNTGIPAPPRGPQLPYYHQENESGAYAVPVLCDECGKEFFVVWDSDPL